jgi:hypothetical protein
MENLFSLFLLTDAVTAQPGSSVAATSLPIVLIVGFTAAVTIGSIAWYNSKRPPGWDGKERPDIVPEIKPEGTPGLGTPDL